MDTYDVTYLLLVVPRVDLIEAQIFYLLLAHQIVLHSAFEVVDLELLTAFRHQLMLVKTGIVANGMLFTLMEVIERETALVWSRDHCAIAPSAMS